MTAHVHPGKRHIQRSFSDQLINVITYIVYALFTFVCLYPFYYLIINSISANNLSERGKVIFWPLQIHFTNYKNLSTIPGLPDAALMSVLRTVVGTVMTVMIAAFLGFVFCDVGMLWNPVDGIVPTVGLIPVCVMGVAALVMVCLGLAMKKWKWIGDYALPISLILGMVSAIPITAWLS